MSNIFQLGTPQLFNTNGLEQQAYPLVNSLPVIYFANSNIHACPISNLHDASINAAVAAGDTVPLINPATSRLWILTLLSVEISVTGTVEFLIDSSTKLHLKIVQNVTVFVPLPKDGIACSANTQKLYVKNTQAVPVDINVNLAYTYYEIT